MKLFEFIQKALSETPESPSAMRVNTFYIIILLTSVIAVGFVVCVLWHKDLILAYLTVIVGLVITALGAKYLQKGKENDSNGTTA